MPADPPENTGKKNPPALPKSKTSLRASDAEELGDADLEEEGIEELESSLLSEAPPSLRGGFTAPSIVDELADESDVTDVPSERNGGAAAKPPSEAPPTARVAVDVAIPESQGSVQTIPPPADYDTIRRVSTGPHTPFKDEAKAPDAAPEPEPPSEVEPAPIVLPAIDPTVFHADEIAVRSSVTPPVSMGKSKPRAVAMPRRTSEPRVAVEPNPEPSEPLRAQPLALEPTERRAGNTRLAVVVAAVLVLGAGVALIGLSSGDEHQDKKTRISTTTDVPAPPPPAVTATSTVATTTTAPEPTPPVATTSATSTSTSTSSSASTQASPPPPPSSLPVAMATAARTGTSTPAPSPPPATTRPSEPASSAKPRGSAPPPGLEFLKPEL